MTERLEDRETGISIRFIREWDIERDRQPLNLITVAVPSDYVDAFMHALLGQTKHDSHLGAIDA